MPQSLSRLHSHPSGSPSSHSGGSSSSSSGGHAVIESAAMTTKATRIPPLYLNMRCRSVALRVQVRRARRSQVSAIAARFSLNEPHGHHQQAFRDHKEAGRRREQEGREEAREARRETERQV